MKCRFYGILCGESQLSESIIVQYYDLDFHAKFLRTKQTEDIQTNRQKNV
jgi:hypothetical protein